jgi:hypothetical protein
MFRAPLLDRRVDLVGIPFGGERRADFRHRDAFFPAPLHAEDIQGLVNLQHDFHRWGAGSDAKMPPWLLQRLFVGRSGSGRVYIAEKCSGGTLGGLLRVDNRCTGRVGLR